MTPDCPVCRAPLITELEGKMYCSNLACNYGIRERSSPQPPDDDCTIGLNPNTCGKNGPILAARGHCSTMCPHVVDSEFPLIEKLRSEPPPEPDDGVPPLSDCEDDQCTIGVNYHPDFQGKASTTRKEPSYTATLSATTPDGTTYQQETDIEWQPPPNTAVKVAEMKKEDRP